MSGSIEGRVIGRGAHGKIVILDDEHVIKVPTYQEELSESFIRELVAAQKGCGNYSGKMDPNSVGVIYPRYDGDLRYLIDNHGITEPMMCLIISQLFQIMADAHNKGFCNRDIKPCNILYRKPGNDIEIAVCDWGLCSCSDDDMDKDIVSMAYRPPELLCNPAEYDRFAIDVWSMGMSILDMIEGGPRYLECISFQQVFQRIQEDISCGFSNIAGECSPDLRDLLSKMLSLNPEDRWSFKELLSHRYVSKTNIPVYKSQPMINLRYQPCEMSMRAKCFDRIFSLHLIGDNSNMRYVFHACEIFDRCSWMVKRDIEYDVCCAAVYHIASCVFQEYSLSLHECLDHILDDDTYMSHPELLSMGLELQRDILRKVTPLITQTVFEKRTDGHIPPMTEQISWFLEIMKFDELESHEYVPHIKEYASKYNVNVH